MDFRLSAEFVLGNASSPWKGFESLFLQFLKAAPSCSHNLFAFTDNNLFMSFRRMI